MTSLICELSGESLATTKETVVVTPSGHLCIKRLLLSKLAENGSVDPFTERSLTEDQLIELASSTSQQQPAVLPPRPQGATSYSNLLHLLHKEYDAVILELFDTRQALQETRQELSQALYQNDAAIRVIARLSMERDEARQQLASLQINSSTTGNGGGSTSTKQPPVATTLDQASSEPASKKQRTDEASAAAETADLPLVNDIPATDLNQMISSWESLHQNRKATQKDAAARAPSDFSNVSASELAWHKTTCKTMTALTSVTSDSDKSYVITSGSDKQIVVYDVTSKTVAWTIVKTQASFLQAWCTTENNSDETNITIIAGQDKTLSLYVQGELASQLVVPSKLVSVSCHPDKNHIVACTSDNILLLRCQENGLVLITTFSPSTKVAFTCGALHPDGLIYIAGTSSGDLQIWDLKNKSMAGTLSGSEAIVSVTVSNNGYHIASTNKSGVVAVWDLRKQKLVASLNEEQGELGSVHSVAFDPSGKYLSYGGEKGIRVSTVKEWGVTASFNSAADHLTWAGAAMMVSAGRKGRKVNIIE